MRHAHFAVVQDSRSHVARRRWSLVFGIRYVGPQFRGLDPITNFMDYVDDVCMAELTSDQSKRMRKQWHAFRHKKAGN